MKNLLAILILITAVTFFNSANAKIWRVNNTTGIVADFTTLQAAHDAASAGDTIHIEPSASGYGGCTFTKKLYVFGNGYFLSGATGNPGLQADSLFTSNLGALTFNAGSQNTILEGLTLSSFYVYTSNITIRRNYTFGYIYLYDGANNFTFQQNYQYYYSLSNQNSSPITGINISNNIIYYAGISFGTGVTTAKIENNTFYYYASMNVYNTQVDNNIMGYGCSFTPNNSVYFNNLSDGTLFGTANSNLSNVTLANVMPLTGSSDAEFQLIPGAGDPAIGSAYGGGNMGAFGGANPYVLSGIPEIPTIYLLTVPATGTSTLNVTISTKSNN